MISGASAVTQDVPPYVTVSGNHARPYGLNLIGLKRRGFSEETVGYLKKAYRMIFRSSLLLSAAADKIREEIKDSPEVDHFVEFIEKSERGVCR